jgi:hypothetical protein
MKSIQLIPSFLTLMLGVFATSAALAESAPKKHRMEVRVDKKSSKSAEKADASMPSVFKHLPQSVVMVGRDGLLLSLSPTATASSELTLQIGGASRCLRVFGQTKGGDTVPLEFGIVKKGDKDPCTGKAPVSPALDLTGSVQEPLQARERRYRLLSCKGPGKCFWYTLIVHRSPGVP